MLKRNYMKNAISMLTVFSLFLCMNISVFATEKNTDNVTNVVSTTSASISGRAISGSGQCTTTGYREFTIYSPAWSLWGHAQITVSGGIAVVSIVSPNGNSAINSGGVTLSPGSHRVGLINTVAGTYSVHVQSVYGDNVTVRVELKDF